MKKTLFSALAVALAVVAGVTAYNSQKVETLSELAMENVEALAGGEIGKGGYTSHTGQCPDPIHYKFWTSCSTGGSEDCYPSDC